MKLYYYDRQANFGDGMNEWLWRRLLPDCWDAADGVFFSGIGTIITPGMPAAKRWIVFSSGVGYGGSPEGFGGDGWSIVSVRGPLSAAVLGLPANAAITDGAMLLATLAEYAPLADAERDGVVFVPHHQSEGDADWQTVCERAGIDYLSATLASRDVIRRIRSAKLVLAEAMHAAIVADTMRVPFVPIVGSPQVNTFKWFDWTRSMGLPYAPVTIPAASVSAAFRHRMLWAHNESHRFENTSEEAALSYFNRRYLSGPHRIQSRLKRIARSPYARAERLLQTPWVANRLGGWDERLLDKTASALSAAARQPGLLSEESVFADRLARLVAGLDTVRGMVGGAATAR